MNEKYKQDLEDLVNIGGSATTHVSVVAGSDCSVICDGEFIGKLAKGEVRKVSVKKGQHVFVFKSKKNPNVFVTKIFNCPSITETYTLVEDELESHLAKSMAANTEKAEKTIFTLPLMKGKSGYLLVAAVAIVALCVFMFVSRSPESRKTDTMIAEKPIYSLKDVKIAISGFSYNENALEDDQRGIEISYILKCDKECNDSIKTIVTLHNFDRIPYTAIESGFSYKGNCAIVTTSRISSRNEHVTLFIPFSAMPKLPKPSGAMENLAIATGVIKYRILCTISILDIENTCVYKSDWEEIDFGKLKDYDQIYGDLNVNKVWLEHNITRSDTKGMVIHSNFDIKNMYGSNCLCVAYFYNNSDKALKDENEKFCTTDGKVSASKAFSPDFRISHYEDFSFFMPYSELHMKESVKNLYCVLKYYHKKDDGQYIFMAESKKQYFNYNR